MSSCCCYQKKYGFFNFIFDIIMIFMTFGLWLIWIFCREMRKCPRCGC